MSIAQSLLPEFDREMQVTRSLLERVPDDQAQWKPHPKSYSIGDLAAHIANLPNWMIMTIRESEVEINPPGGFPPRIFGSAAANAATFDRNVATARELLAATSDETMRETWTLASGGKKVLAMPRAAVLRSFVMNHVIHHRGQLSVYLRLLDVPLPEMYGPTADSKR